MLSIFIMYAISSSTFLLAKQLLLYSSPLFLAGIRTLTAGLLLLLVALYTTKQTVLHIKKFLLPCILIALYSFYLSNTLKFWALHYLSSNSAAVISITEPLFTIIFAYLMFNEQMSIKKWVGMIICMCSGLMLANNGLPVLSMQGFDFVALPSIILCIAIASSAYGALLMRQLIKYENASPILIMGMSMTIAGILALSTTCIETSSCTVTSATFVPFMSSLMMMILLSNILAYSLYGELLKHYSALLITCGSFIKPIFIILYKGIFLNEVLQWHVGYSTILLLCGLMIIYYDELPLKKVAIKTAF